MTNPFSSYYLIKAERIIKSNVRPSHIEEDLSSLIKTLVPLKYLSASNVSEGACFERSLIERFIKKPDTLSLLEFFGYVNNDRGLYIYYLPKSDREKENRQKGVNEFGRFFNDLKNAENGSLSGFEQFIQNSNRHSNSDTDNESDDEPVSRRSSTRSTFISPPFPDRFDVDAANEETIEIIKTFKKSLVTEYNTPPTYSFIRRKLAILLYRQNNPGSIEFDNDIINQRIDLTIRSLKQNDRQTNVNRTDEVYIECLIRSNFDENEALELLRNRRPNLTPPIEQPVPNVPAKISIANSIQPLRQHCHLLNNENTSTQHVPHESDKWQNIKHLIPAIQQLRQNVDDASLSKMYRLLYSELSCVIDPQLPVKIETLASILCELPLESIENIDIASIKDILRLQFDDNFGEHVKNILSLVCPICTVYFPRSQMETMYLCDHMCCLDCIKTYYRNNINKIGDCQSLNRLTCFHVAHPITEETKMDFFIYLGAKLNQWFADEPDIRELYDVNIFNATRKKQIKKCGNSKCPSSFDTDNNNDIGCAYCPHCRFAQCAQCCRKWYPEHVEMECDEYQEWLIENDPDDIYVQLFKCLNINGGIECPNCGNVYEYKAGGCEHFTCQQCQTDFCRMCLNLFYLPTKNQKCPQANCTLKTTIHAHCAPNCFRETRIGENNAIIKLLNDHRINVNEELQNKSVSINKKCPVEDCGKATSKASGDRLCESCFKQFLCLLVWNEGLEPWEIYEDNNLRQMLVKASVVVPTNAKRENLIALAKENLNRLLGKPKKLSKPRL